MNSSKKSIAEYKQSKPEQLQLFELDPNLEDYSNSIELYDTMPKYHVGGAEREKGEKVESLPILNRDFYHRNKPYSIEISPAAIYDKKSGKTIYYYPSQREELVEDALRKIATKGRAMQFDDKVGVKFTYYEVQQELEKMGHGYAIKEIKLAIEILGKAGLEIISKDDEVSITSNFFTWIGKETHERGGKERVVVMFHNLVTRSINHGTYRLLNYDKMMKMKMPLARWLHKRISHLFSQATVNNPYPIKLSTIVRDSGMKNYKNISERKRQVDKAIEELKSVKVISHFDFTPDKEKNKILDVLYSLFMSEEFVADAKKANKLTNLRLTNSEEKEPYNLDELRKEIEKPIYGLTKTMINNYLSKIFDKDQYNLIVNALEAVKQYVESKKKKNEPLTNLAAITKAAIKEGWEPKKDESIAQIIEEKKLSLEESEKERKEHAKNLDLQKELQKNPSWLQIKEKIKTEFGEDDWKKWFIKIEIFSLGETEITLSVPDKFTRDWVVREFVENKNETSLGSLKDLQDLIKEVLPKINKVNVICGNLF